MKRQNDKGVLKKMESEYSAINIAAALISEADSMNLPVTNLALQKYLFYIQLWNMRSNKCPAFSDGIEAWRHGPVIRDIYEKFRKYISSPIDPQDKVLSENRVYLDNDTMQVVQYVLQKYSELSDWDLVRLTRATQPWEDAYISGETAIIPKESLFEFSKTIQ